MSADPIPSSMSEGRAELLRRLLSGRGAAPTAATVVHAPRTGRLPASSAQERLWFLEELHGANAAYNVPLVLRIDGALDLPTLRESLTVVVRRHEALRTTLAPDDDGLRQLVAPAWSPEITCVQTRDIAEADRDIEREAQVPFSLASAEPLLRARLYRTGPDRHSLFLNLHHAVTDGWSEGVLFRELWQAYRQSVSGESVELPRVRMHYADYAHWEAAQRDSEDAREQLRYWRRRLADPPVLDLPADRPRPAVPSVDGGSFTIDFPDELVDRLEEFAEGEGVTPFVVLLSVLYELLHRYSGQDDIVVGTTMANRTREEFEDTIGFFVNTVALRQDLSDVPSFKGLLLAVRDTLRSAQQRQQVPFARVVEAVARRRDAAVNPLFQVMCSFHDSRLALGDDPVPGLRLEFAEVPQHTTHFDLSLNLERHSRGLVCRFGYAHDLFDEPRVRRLAGHYLTLLRALVTAPGLTPAQVPLLDERELREQAEWNATGRDYPGPFVLHHLVAEQAARTPGATAVRYEGAALTYRETDTRAGLLARALRDAGVRRGDVVAVVLDRSLGLPAALLGVLKSGAAYAPLDPESPDLRLRGILTDGAIRTVVTTREQTARFDLPGVRVIALEDVPEHTGDAGEPWSCAQSEPDDPAYLIYTSGSTGKPKGVVVSHRAITNQLLWRQEVFGLARDERVLQKTPYTFDVSLWEFFWPLIGGGVVVLAPPGGHRDPACLAELIQRERISTVHFVPSMLQLFLEDPAAVRCTGLARVLCGGEALSGELRERFFRTLHGVELHNLYGPTEAAVDVTHWQCSPGEGPVVPLGRPVANTGLHVLDHHGRPLPVGVTGELYLSGVQLAAGYHRRPDLTAEAFVRLPDETGGSRRMYRTGDLVRRLPDGTLEYRGRRDAQVKLRGFRIELREIEAVVAGHPMVADCAVLVREQRLVAYVTGHGAGLADPGELAEYTAARLPGYMVPADWVPLPEMPLTSSGKLDRRALPTPSVIAAPAGREPRDAAERLLCTLIGEVLDRPWTDVDADFFEHGGHSLLAIRLVSRIRASFRTDLAIRAVFEQPTAAGLARLLSGGPGEQTPPGATPPDGASDNPAPLVAAQRPPRVPLSYGQRRMWLLNRFEEQRAAYNMHTALRVTGPLDVTALEAALADLTERHEILRTVYPEADGTPHQVVLDAETHRPRLCLHQVHGDLAEAVAEHASEGFDVTIDPPLRTHLFTTGPDEHVLLVVLHHIASDGWSYAPLWRDLALAYEARNAGRPPSWEPLPVQYADHTLWQHRVLGDPADPDSVLAQQRRFWTERLSGLPEELNLPADRPRPAVASHRGGTVRFQVPTGVHRALAALSRDASTSLFMTCQTALAALLTRMGAGTDIPVGVPTAGRTDDAQNDLIGFFVNTLVLRADTAGDPTLRDLLSQVRETSLAGYGHPDLPFELLVEALNPARSTARHPLFQVMLAFHNTAGTAPALPGLRVEEFAVAERFAMFDLLLEMRERTDGHREPAGLDCQLTYSTDLFDQETARAVTERLCTVLTALAEDPDRRLSEVSLLSPAERRALEVWNDTEAPCPQLTLTDLFEQQVARTPDLPAVDHGGRVLDYAELNERANRLARHLVQLGIGPDDVVALLLPRSAETVVALLAVLKAGAGYLPLDPAHPVERIATVLADAAPSLVVTAPSIAAEFRDTHPGLRWLCPEESGTAAEVLARPAADLTDADRVRPLTPLHTAYVIYTSGSTGLPKGVVMHHHALVNLLIWQGRTERTGPGRRTAQFTALTFDVSAQEILSTLVAGATLLVPDLDIRNDFVGFVRWLDGSGATDLFAPNVVLEALFAVATDEGIALAELTRVAQAGEALLLSEQLRAFAAARPGRRISNHYGPTETHVVTAYELPEDTEVWPSRAPIGGPVANIRAYVLDERLNPVPPGVPGELYVSGSGVARGYLGRPVLTAERFVPCPFAGPGERMYRTGDIVRRSAEGSLEFLGRADHQVKIRGFRIELGDVEVAVASHPAVSQAKVLAVDHPTRGRQLAAYAVTAEGALPPTAEDLRAHVARKVPAYMVPATYALLDSMPVTANGKVDQKALADMGGQLPEGTYTAPRTRTQSVIAALWEELLGVVPVGIHESFFALGGHSLLATQAVARIRSVLGVSVSMTDFFGRPTVAELARHVDDLTTDQACPTLEPRIVPRPRTRTAV
ncbi:amino acid adenylation domain-containing protein [Streptomyces sp. NPDC051677]|uniref:amino acid adenylation domain-containing protein n=1 Tax=Streptomyces sp. NPDC051677 TaxID=3365669 RepID=UPI0037D93F90